MRALEYIRDHVTFKLPYDFSYRMKTPYIGLLLGFSLLDLSKVIKNMTPGVKKHNVKRRTKKERIKVTPKENPRKTFTLASLGSAQLSKIKK